MLTKQGLWAALCIVGLLVCAPALAEWSEGEFNGALNWEGTVSHNSNPWEWAKDTFVPMHLLAKEAQTMSDGLSWSGLLKSAVLLKGHTKRYLPQGREGVVPVVEFGKGLEAFQLQWLGDGMARLSLPVMVDGGESAAGGRFSFVIRVANTMIATQGQDRLGFSLYASADGETRGNGLPARAQALAGAKAWELNQRVFGPALHGWKDNRRDMELAPREQLSRSDLTAVAGLYTAEVVEGSGELLLHSMAPGISRWSVPLPIQISYY
ncbi:hypothetical protein [Chromobacterium haemolyticum]|nr:hypothetical protein [Chromobacterium haemolyticum]